MYIRKNFHRHVSVSGSVRAFDNAVSLGYEFNESGFIRNDFSQLQERENEVGYLRALSQMREYVEQNSNEGKTFEQIVAAVRPRWCQLNGEVDRFEQYLIDNALDFYKKLRDDGSKQNEVAKEVADGVGIDVTSEPAVVK